MFDLPNFDNCKKWKNWFFKRKLFKKIVVVIILILVLVGYKFLELKKRETPERIIAEIRKTAFKNTTIN